LKDALLLAAQTAGGGGPDGLHNYLAKQAEANPTAFMAMLSKAIPLQPTGGDGGKIIVEIVKCFDAEDDVTLTPDRVGKLSRCANRSDGNRARLNAFSFAALEPRTDILCRVRSG